MRTITKVILSAGAIVLFVGCTNQPNVNKYVNPKIKNETLKQQKFKEDSLRCDFFADKSVSQPNKTYNFVPNNSSSGNFDMTNIATGQQYSGTYDSYSSGGFSTGLANGAAVGSMWADGIKAKQMKDRAWKYCMLSAGWHEK